MIFDGQWYKYQKEVEQAILNSYNIPYSAIGELQSVPMHSLLEGETMKFNMAQLTVEEIESLAQSLYGLSAKEAKEKEGQILLQIRQEREQEALHRMFSRGTFKPDLQK